MAIRIIAILSNNLYLINKLVERFSKFNIVAFLRRIFQFNLIKSK